MAGEHLAELLGLGPGARALVVSCSGLGSCHAANHGIYEALRRGGASGAELLVAAPWAREAVSRYLGEDIGVELALNAEHDYYRWGPLTHAPSLLDGDGGFPRTPEDTWDHADLDEVRRECRAQVERAIWWGVDVTHLTSHLETLVLRPEFFDVYLELALEFALPMRLPDRSVEERTGFPFRALAASAGAVFPDRSVQLPPDPIPWGTRFARLVSDLAPGVTELVLAPATDTPELRALTPGWSAHVEDLELLMAPANLAALLDRAGVVATSWRALRAHLRRRGSGPPVLGGV